MKQSDLSVFHNLMKKGLMQLVYSPQNIVLLSFMQNYNLRNLNILQQPHCDYLDSINHQLIIHLFNHSINSSFSLSPFLPSVALILETMHRLGNSDLTPAPPDVPA